MRNAFADEATKLGQSDPRVVLLSGDIGNRLFDKFKDKNEGRFINCGIAEANMMGLAAGMALSGLRPIVYTITPFTTTRCFEQIRVDACYHNVPVIIVGTGSGLSYAELGPTHHSCEDLAILRVLPNMTVFAPADEVELRQCMRAALKLNGPVYIRIGKKGEQIIPKSNDVFEVGRSITIKQGSDVCLIGTGTIMPELLKAAEIMVSKGVSVRVESCHTIKPLDVGMLENVSSIYSLVVVIEEHSRIGGLGSAVAEWVVAQNTNRPRVLAFGTDDEFMHEIGSQEYARKKNGLMAADISAKVLQVLHINGAQ